MAKLALRPEVAERFKLAIGATADLQVSHRTMGVIRLADVNLEQAHTLVADGCKLLQPLKKKEEAQ
ncbi:MAG: hypothetical protein Q8J69_07765 [Sphingobacteriaceae bacterium]|nr:hypothetical protein [Sphingobacteriaceae bacterium]